jgi:DNA-directed RNA polymerase subunit RPC12/RpoP
MICSDCDHYNYVTERCYKFGLEKPLLESCMYHVKVPEVIRRDQALWWGADKDDPDVQWYLCPRCNEWFKTSIHYCSGKIMMKSKPLLEDFLTEKEMKV